MKFLTGILLGMYSLTLILIQGFWIEQATAFPEGLFYISTVICIIITILLLVKSAKDK